MNLLNKLIRTKFFLILKASKYGEGKRYVTITVKKKDGTTYERRQLVGSSKKEKPKTDKPVKDNEIKEDSVKKPKPVKDKKNSKKDDKPIEEKPTKKKDTKKKNKKDEENAPKNESIEGVEPEPKPIESAKDLVDNLLNSKLSFENHPLTRDIKTKSFAEDLQLLKSSLPDKAVVNIDSLKPYPKLRSLIVNTVAEESNHHPLNLQYFITSSEGITDGSNFNSGWIDSVSPDPQHEEEINHKLKTSALDNANEFFKKNPLVMAYYSLRTHKFPKGFFLNFDICNKAHILAEQSHTPEKAKEILDKMMSDIGKERKPVGERQKSIMDNLRRMSKGQKPLPWGVANFTSDPKEIVRATIIHEIGHQRHEGIGYSKFLKEFQKGRYSVSQYGKTSYLENFAECYAHFRLNGNDLSDIPSYLAHSFKTLTKGTVKETKNEDFFI